MLHFTELKLIVLMIFVVNWAMLGIEAGEYIYFVELVLSN